MNKSVRYFLDGSKNRFLRIIPYLIFLFVMGMPSWIGDANPIYMFPFFIAAFLLCYDGTILAKAVLGVIFYSLLIPLNMIVDTLSEYYRGFPQADNISTGVKLLVWCIIWYTAKKWAGRRKKTEMPRSMWILVGTLALTPLFGVVAFTIGPERKLLWEILQEPLFYDAFKQIAFGILPWIFLSSMALLYAIVILERREVLEQEFRLAGMREIYYGGLKREQQQVRSLKHDMRNHMAALSGMIKQGNYEKAENYLEELTDTPVFKGIRSFCENEMADIVLGSKAEIMEMEGMQSDFMVSIPKDTRVSDTDICALIGNALDNAIEAVRETEDKRIIVRARSDKGIFMFRVENASPHNSIVESGSFKTTKEDKKSHGFGLAAISEIAQRYGGSMEAKSGEGRFELVVYIPL